jgi:Ras family
MPQQDTDREVTPEEGENFAKTHGCLFVETSAKADVAVTQAFEELVLKVCSSCCQHGGGGTVVLASVLSTIDIRKACNVLTPSLQMHAGVGNAQPAHRCGELTAARGRRHPAATVGLLWMSLWQVSRTAHSACAAAFAQWKLADAAAWTAAHCTSRWTVAIPLHGCGLLQSVQGSATSPVDGLTGFDALLCCDSLCGAQLYSSCCHLDDAVTGWLPRPTLCLYKYNGVLCEACGTLGQEALLLAADRVSLAQNLYAGRITFWEVPMLPTVTLHHNSFCVVSVRQHCSFSRRTPLPLTAAAVVNCDQRLWHRSLTCTPARMSSDAAQYVAVISEFVEALVHQILFVRAVSVCPTASACTRALLHSCK